MKNRSLSIIIVFSLITISMIAAPPRTLTYQGKLTNTGGNVITTPVNITFRIFNVVSGGTALWTEDHTSVPVTNGLFDVTLGESTPITLDFDMQYWIEVQVGSETLTPREKMAAVPYAHRAVYASNIDDNWSLSGDDITNTNSGNVGVGTPSPDPSAKLDVTSTESGLLIPRMTESERDAISSPATSLQIFNLDTRCFEIFDGTEWCELWCGPPCFECGVSTVTDIDGNEYNTVLIGTQCWMKENLKVTKYNDSTPILNITDNTAWATTDDTPAYCWYNNNYATWGFRGAIYNGVSVNPYYNSGKNMCPEGWHVPTDADWTVLTDYLSSDPAYWCGGNSSYIAKSLANTTGWVSYDYSPYCYVGANMSSNNLSGFSAIASGTRNSGTGNFNYDSDWVAEWWSSSYNGGVPYHIIDREMMYNWEYVYRNAYSQRTSGKCVRCIKD